MKAIVYLPKNEEQWNEFEKQAGYIVGKALLERINSFSISYAEKTEILKELKNEL